MVKIEVKCPNCGGVKTSKNGKTETGKQCYICNNKDFQCKSFMIDYTYNGNKHGIENQIISMTANASGIRDTARVLGISTDKVMSTFKKQHQR